MEINQVEYPNCGSTNYYIASANMEILNGGWADRLHGVPKGESSPWKYHNAKNNLWYWPAANLLPFAPFE